MSNLIDSLKRLERAGAENSRTTQKLREAANVAAEAIEAVVPRGVVLPRGYMVARDGKDYSHWELSFTAPKGDTIDPDFAGYYDPRELKERVPFGTPRSYPTNADGRGFTIPAPRRLVLQFAADIADGLLDEIAAFLEERAAQNAAATATLEAAKAAQV